VAIDRIENAFEYHSPTDAQQRKYVAIRNTAREVAYMLTELCPDSRELSLAMTKLEETVMWANAAIARNTPP